MHIDDPVVDLMDRFTAASTTPTARCRHGPGVRCWRRHRRPGSLSRSSSRTAQHALSCAGATTGETGTSAVWTSAKSEMASPPKAWPTSRLMRRHAGDQPAAPNERPEIGDQGSARRLSPTRTPYTRDDGIIDESFRGYCAGGLIRKVCKVQSPSTTASVTPHVRRPCFAGKVSEAHPVGKGVVEGPEKCGRVGTPIVE